VRILKQLLNRQDIHESKTVSAVRICAKGNYAKVWITKVHAT